MSDRDETPTYPTASGWTPRGTQQVNFRAGELLPALESRAGAETGISVVARRDLDRYYRLLELSLARFSLSAGEASLIVDALNGTLTEPHTASLLWATVDDALADGTDGLAEKWQVDGPALVARLRRLTLFEALAVADAAERYWLRVAAGVEETHEERLRAVGLLS